MFILWKNIMDSIGKDLWGLKGTGNRKCELVEK